MGKYLGYKRTKLDCDTTSDPVDYFSIQHHPKCFIICTKKVTVLVRSVCSPIFMIFCGRV